MRINTDGRFDYRPGLYDVGAIEASYEVTQELLQNGERMIEYSTSGPSTYLQ